MPATPTPVKLTVCVPAVSVIVSSALSVLATEGVNFTLIAQEPPLGANEVPAQLSVSEKSEAFVPEMATLETLVFNEPRLLSITVSGLDVIPSGWVGNIRGFGKGTAAAAGPFTSPATERIRVLSSTTKSSEASAPAAVG